MTALGRAALEVYAGAGQDLAPRYEAVDAEAVFAPLLDLLPPPCAMLDVGAGTGRDAAWFEARGYTVTAVEPTEALRRIGEARPGSAVEWIDDTLPRLDRLAARRFGLVLVNAVWHHLGAAERDDALERFAALTDAGGRLLIALRQGPVLPGQPVARLEAEAEIARAAVAGFAAAGRRDGGERIGGVDWTWLALERVRGETA